MKSRILISTLILGTLLAAGATAQPRHRGPGSHFWGDLAADFDKNNDGKITLDEFGGAEATFGNLDRDGDGVLTEADFARGPGMRVRGRMAGGFLLHLADGNGDGTLTSAEFDAFLAKLDADGDGLITGDEIRAVLPFDGHRRGGPGGPGARPGGRFDHDGDGDLEVADLRAVFADLDADGNGELSGDELPGFGFMHGPRGERGGGLLVRRADDDDDGAVSQAEWQAFVGQLDANGDGKIDSDEWHAAGPRLHEPPPGRFEMLVGMLDRNGNGILEPSDLNALFAELDADGSGVIESDELPRFRMRHRRG